MPLSDASADLADYRDHLKLIAAWLGPLEQWLASFDDGPQQALPVVVRMPLIVSDLAFFSPLSRAAEIPLPVDPPTAQDAAYRWGVCYVIEGSQLGGAVLYRRLRETLAPHPLRYLSGQGISGSISEPGQRWKDFMEAIRAHVTSANDIERACAGAIDAFDLLKSRVPQPALEERE